MTSTRTTLPALNRRLAKLNVELVKGEGYFYFVYEDGNPRHHATTSVYTYRLNNLPPALWIEDAEAFAAKCEAQFAEWDEPLQYGRNAR